MFYQDILTWAEQSPFEAYTVMVILLIAFCYLIEKWG